MNMQKQQIIIWDEYISCFNFFWLVEVVFMSMTSWRITTRFIVWLLINLLVNIAPTKDFMAMLQGERHCFLPRINSHSFPWWAIDFWNTLQCCYSCGLKKKKDGLFLCQLAFWQYHEVLPCVCMILFLYVHVVFMI